jgi:hypothetical protein
VENNSGVVRLAMSPGSGPNVAAPVCSKLGIDQYMALVSGYSSEEDNVKNTASNPFGITRSTSNPAKRVKLDGPSLAVVAAPDVLAEVNNSL